MLSPTPPWDQPLGYLSLMLYQCVKEQIVLLSNVYLLLAGIVLPGLPLG